MGRDASLMFTLPDIRVQCAYHVKRSSNEDVAGIKFSRHLERETTLAHGVVQNLVHLYDQSVFHLYTSQAGWTYRIKGAFAIVQNLNALQFDDIAVGDNDTSRGGGNEREKS
jgi:hypothetical protein